MLAILNKIQKNVALAKGNLIQKPKGEKPYRSIVDKIGMGNPIKDQNNHLANVTKM